MHCSAMSWDIAMTSFCIGKRITLHQVIILHVTSIFLQNNNYNNILIHLSQTPCTLFLLYVFNSHYNIPIVRKKLLTDMANEIIHTHIHTYICIIITGTHLLPRGPAIRPPQKLGNIFSIAYLTGYVLCDPGVLLYLIASFILIFQITTPYIIISKCSCF